MDESSVRVALRIRPQIPREQIDMCRVCTSVTPGEPQVWMGSDKAFTYDYVFDTDSVQESVYDNTVRDLVEGCYEGYNATVLAYGQTGSGKTYTMGTGFDVEVSEDLRGIIPRAVRHLFRGIRERQEDARMNGMIPPEFQVNAQFMELYNEEIIDLLSETRDPFSSRTNRPIRIHEDGAGGIYTVGTETRVVVNEEEALACLRIGALSRTTASTQMNVQSSRSHAIFTLHIKQQRLAQPDEDENKEMASTEFETLTAKFHFVDLAGSERLKRTGATGERAKEGISINCGLLALGNVISALGDKTKRVSHVPYRDSKLTRLLQDSLGGNSRTLMIACVSPTDRDFMETLNTMKYANRARNIKNRVTVNQDKNSKTISLLRHEIQQLQLELMEYKQGKRVLNADGTEGINDMYHENTLLQSENQNLRMRIKALQETVDFMKTQNIQLQTEKAEGKWITDGESGETMTTMVGEYLKQIEDLRTKLLESENMCQQLRNRSPGHRTSLTHSQVAMSGHYDIRIDGSTTNIDTLIMEAKKNVEKKEKMIFSSKRRLISESEEKDEEKEKEEENEDEESSSDKDPLELEESDSEDETENENVEGELADIQSDISLKQRLIEELELSQKKMQNMKQQYEDKLLQLQSKIKATQEERDRVLANMTNNSSKGGEQAQKVKADYEKRLNNMQKELKALQMAKKEHTKLLKQQGLSEKQLKTLRSELAELKRTKVKLMNKMKEETSRHKEVETKRNKEIAQLRKDQRKKDNEISKLEAERRLKESILRRKQEEIQSLRKITKNPLSERAAGRLNRKTAALKNNHFSPKVAKQKWQSLEKSIDKIVINKKTIADMESDMERWLNEREETRRELQRAMKKRDLETMTGRNDETLLDLEDQLENLKAKMQYVNDNIQECQVGITQMDSEEVGAGLDNGTILSGLSSEEISYLLQKIVNMAISQSYVAAQKEARIRDLELQTSRLETDARIQEELLCHVLQAGGMDQAYVTKSLGIPGEDNQSSGSSNSSRTTSPSESMFSSNNPMTCSVYGVESMNNLGKQIVSNKARRRTATTEELLYVNGNPPDATLIPSVSPIKEEPLSYRASQPRHPSLNIMSKSLTLPSGTGVDNIKLSPTARRKIYNRQESYSPKVERRAHNLNLRSGSASGEASRETSPPSSPTGSKRGGTREENVFSRLTSGTGVSSVQRPSKGYINPYSNVRSIPKHGPLVCTSIAEGHSKAVLSLAATSELLFSGSKDRTVKVWDLHAGREIQSLSGHPNNVSTVRYAPRSRLLFSASSSYIKVWDLRMSGAQCIKTLASSGFCLDGPIEISTPSRITQPPAGEHAINDVVVSLSENLLYSAVGEKVRVWDLKKFMAIGKLSGGHQAAVMCLAIDSPTQTLNTVITGSKDHYIKVFNVDEYRCENNTQPRHNLEPPHYDGVQCLALAGDVLFSGSRDRSIKKWDLTRSELVQSLNGAHKDWVCGLSFLPSKQALLSACRGGYLKLWDVSTCQVIQEIRAHNHPINALATNNQAVFTASNSGEVKVWGQSMSVSTGSLFQLCL